MARICCERDAEPAFAERAATWLAGFHRDVVVTIEAGTVTLVAAGWTEQELMSLWQSARANERLFEEGADDRAGLLRMLVE